MINLKLQIGKLLQLPVLLSFTVAFSAFAQEKNEATKTLPIFKDGEAQIVTLFDTPDKWIRTDLWVETSFDTDGDGKPDRMHVDVTRPYQTETEGLKLPVIYESSPYYAGTAGNDKDVFWDVKHELGEKSAVPRVHPEVVRTGKRPIISNSLIREWVKRGFIVVHSSSPGTGLSQGSPTVGGINESLAPKAVIEWLSGKDNGYTTADGNEKVKAYWSTGSVGMTGTSYNGTIPVAAATTGVEGLKAIIPIAPNTSYYHYYRSNGLVRSPGGYLGEDVDVLYDYIHSGAEDKRAYANQTIRDGEMAKGMDRITGDYNNFWAGRDYLNAIKPMKAALLMSHGFNDWNVMPEHSYRIYKAAEAKGLPVQIYYHQQGHGGPPPMKMMNRWFTRYLFGIENGVEKEPKAWIVRENEPNSNPTPYADYPNPDASNVKLYLGAGGKSSGNLYTAKQKKQPLEKLTDDVSFSGSDLAKAENSDHCLLYVSPVLKEAVHLSGLTQFTVKLASNKPSANFSVWLVALPWTEGNKVKLMDNVITRGWADPQNSKSLTESAALSPGKFYELKFNLQPDDQIIPAGKKIALMIFSSDKEFTLWPKAGTELTIDLNATTLTLPVVGGLSAFEKAIK
ncbi:Xaa-Pro dipeptidyl-peptidase [Pedobacter sp. GSP4]|uniref:Xaa-Pro dipeptidyl-peptidase n=1 Tax=Pedobacter sp. GSP4 TaxID=3453716 RepID=UPI003EE8ABC1